MDLGKKSVYSSYTHFERELSILEKKFGPQHRSCEKTLNNLAHLLKENGQFNEAKVYMQRALEINKKTYGPDHPYTALSFENLGLLLQTMGDYAGAEFNLEHALKINQQELGSEHLDTALSLNSMGNLYVEKRDYQNAKKYLERALTIHERVHKIQNEDTALILNNLGGLIYSLGDAQSAKLYMERALAINEQIYGTSHPAIAKNLFNLGLMHWFLGNIDLAMKYSGRGIELEEKTIESNLNIGDAAQKQAFMKTLVGSTYKPISLHINNSLKSADAATLALQTILRRKGRILDATISEFQNLQEHMTPEQRAQFDKRTKLREQLSYLEQKPQKYMTSYGRSKQLSNLKQQIKAIESKLIITNAEFKDHATPITVENVQFKIPEKTALIELFVYHPFNPAPSKPQKADIKWDQSHYVAYVLHNSGSLRWVSLGSAKMIDSAAIALRRAISTRSADVLETARKLDALTMDKIRPLLGDTKTLLISPDGQLNLVPFATLLNNKTGKFLVEEYKLSYLASGRDLLRSITPAANNGGSLIIGNADYSGSIGKVASLREGERGAEIRAIEIGPLAQLPGAGDEVRAIGSILDLPKENILIGKDATEEIVKAVKRPQILHLATHGFFLPNSREIDLERFLGDSGAKTPYRPEDPLLRSGLALSGFNSRNIAGNANNSVLTALEVSDLDLWGTEVVTLSACETALGDVHVGEGVFGLRRALVLAGARSQMISLWKIADTPTKELMVSWYGQLKSGVGRADALHAVQLASIKGKNLPVTEKELGRGSEQELAGPSTDSRISGTRHPYYWASFILSGATGPLEVMAK